MRAGAGPLRTATPRIFSGPMSDPNDDPSSPQTMLQGVRVLDLSRVLAGPWASQLLGDLGAEIIKIERPQGGDDTRAWGPPFFDNEDGSVGDAAYFFAANRNKKSVAIDFGQPDGAELIQELAGSSDILIENFKVGGLKKYGLDYKNVSERNPAIVYCSVTGFGQTGPKASRPGYDYMIQAMGGLMSVTGQPDGAPGGEPMKVGVAVADLFAGMYASNAILAALRHAERTGEGQHLDVSLFDCQIAMLANQAMNFFMGGSAPKRLGNAHPNIAPYQAFETADGYIVIAVGNDTQFRALAGAIGLPVIAADKRFETNRLRVANRDALIEFIAPQLRLHTTVDLIAKFESAGVPAGPVQDIASVFEDPQTQARSMKVPMRRSGAGAGGGDEINVTGHPVKYSKTPAAYAIAPPTLGAHTEDVLEKSLGLDAREISALRQRGVIA